MDDSQQASNQMQNGMRDARTHVNRQKSRRGIEPPRTVREQLDELETQVDGVRRRDPVAAAAKQHVERDNGVYYEKLPDRHARRADRDNER